jgi:hypothetical protein
MPVDEPPLLLPPLPPQPVMTIRDMTISITAVIFSIFFVMVTS